MAQDHEIGLRAASRVLIVGAGPTGLTAAIELARRGITPRVIDRDEAPTPLSKAVGIGAHTLEILDPSGVTERLLAKGTVIRHAYAHYGGGRLATIRFAAIRHRFHFLLSLPQSETETVMAEVLHEMGLAVERRTELTRLRQEDGSVSVELDGPSGREQAAYDIVFGADGAHSKVREAAGLAFEGYTRRRRWSIADADIPDWPYETDAAHLFLQRGGDVGFVIPIGESRFRAVSNTEDALAHIPGPYSIARVLRTDSFEIPVRQARSYQQGGVYLGGDAAHVHSPVGARGMNLGIEDAAAFARRLAEGDLTGYTAERRPIGRRWIAFSERALGIVQSTNAIGVALRNLGIRLAGWLPVLQRPMLERVAGLKE